MATLDLNSLEEMPEVDSDTASVRTETALAPSTLYNQSGIEADMNASDVRIPRINLLQKSSELAEEDGWNPGDIAFAKEVKLVPFGSAAKVSFLHLRRQYQQHLEWGSQEKPLVYDTREEVFANGGSLQYNAANEYRPIAHLTMLIEQPADADESDEAYFPLAFDGKQYSLAMWTVGSSAYTSVAKELMTAASIFLKDGIHKVAWELTVENKKSGTNSFMVPKVKQAGKHSPEFVEFLEALLPR